MRIYVDFDDCLCETAQAFTKIAFRLFGKRVPYEEVRFFNLKESFDLNEEEYEQMMEEGHKPEILLSYWETPGASEVINALLDEGHEVCIITGRPVMTYEPSRKWLDEHGLNRVELFFLDKYGRDTFYQKGSYNLELEDFYRMHFDYAVEDSPLAFQYLDHFPDMKVMVFDRPWNRECQLADRYLRCVDWNAIRRAIK